MTHYPPPRKRRPLLTEAGAYLVAYFVFLGICIASVVRWLA